MGKKNETQKHYPDMFVFVFQDRFADEELLPPLDDEKNYELTGFEESDTKTVLKFYRKFDTCDPRDRALKVP